MLMEYTLRRSARARAMRLEVRADGSIVLTAPIFSGLSAIKEFFMQHSEWMRRHLEKMKGRDVVRLRRTDIPILKRRALALCRERAAHYAAQYGLKYQKLSIRAQKSRWGSCSRSGNLSFNYKIAALPRHIADYIIVHEICHLVQFNHSKTFWTLVAQSTPEHRKIRSELRKTSFVFYPVRSRMPRGLPR